MSRLISDTSLYVLWKVYPNAVGIDRLKVIRDVSRKHDPAALDDYAEDVLTRRWRNDRERALLVDLLCELQSESPTSIAKWARDRLHLIEAERPARVN
jgi:hypothetical protein